MKKLITILGLASLTLSLQAASFTLTIPGNTMTNLLPTFNGSTKVTQIVVTAPSMTNTSVQLIDCVGGTNLTYTQAAYTNQISYSTNWNYIYTNYFGVTTTNSYTNVLYDVTNNVVAAVTAAYPVRAAVAVPAGNSYKLDQVNYYFMNGIGVTNTSTGLATVSITYQQ